MFRILLLIFALKNIAFSACYEDCTGLTMPLLEQTITSISVAYNGLDAAMIVARADYRTYLKVLTLQNILLQDIVRFRRHNSIKMKEINFLLDKIIKQKDVQIDINLQKDILKFQKSLMNTKDVK